MTRVPFLLLGILPLLAGLGGGLVRMGWPIGGLPAGATTSHGALMITGFLGTVIGLERAVALGHRWAYAAPLGTGSGALLYALTGLASPGRELVVAGAAVLVAASTAAFRFLPARWTATQAAGSVAFLCGSLLWASGQALPSVLPWWEAFVVLTIAGERLELSRLLQPGVRALGLFAGAVGLLAAGAALWTVDPEAGVRVSGAAWIGLALWLARWDLARKSLRRPGLPRFMAVAVLSGHFWLGAAGLLAQGPDAGVAGFYYDASLHALVLGFVFSMVFGHGPVIFPSILRARIRFRRRFYLHLVLLHASVLTRVGADLAGAAELRAWSGLGSAVAVLIFLAQTVTSLERAPRAPRREAL